jgi:multiple sugar transport system ATP-binding protein
MASVSLEKVSKTFPNGQKAVIEATFEVADGELVVLVGPSGCGKSTLLRMVAGLEEITSGTLRIGHRVVNDVPPKERDIAMVFQSYALYPHMTVAENLAFGLKLRGESADTIAARVQESAAQLGIGNLLERRPRQLSGGQRQRVALGRALVRKPQVFLLDEPLSNLDAKLRMTTRTEIAKLHRNLKATMLYVTHDQIEAMTLGQRIVVLDAGVVQQIDTPMRLYDRPANVFVATFLGSPAMNLFRDGQLAGPEPAGSDLIVGLRPEHLHVANGADGGAGSGGAAGLAGAGTSAGLEPTASGRLPAKIEAIEPVGNEIFITARAGAQEVTARVPPQPLPGLGKPITFSYPFAKLHYFRADSGQRVGS